VGARAGRRQAVERELEKDKEAPMPNAIFDESGNFLLYPTLLGIKMVNVVSNALVKILGKVENTERFLRVALFQGVPKSKRCAIPRLPDCHSRVTTHLRPKIN
jgi:peptidylprolyl isomerase domain and WD repeat-containing protein 1